MRPCWWFFCLTLFVAGNLPYASAQSEGFLYLPSGPSFSNYLTSEQKLELELTTVIANVAGGAFRSTDRSGTFFYGFGGLWHRRWQKQPFVSFNSQLGFYFFVGEPQDASLDKRKRVSLQSPLGLSYAIRLYRESDDEKGGKTLTLFAGPLFPLAVDLTGDGVTHSGSFGPQGGLSYSMPLTADSFIDLRFSVAKILVGYFFNNDLSNGDFSELDGTPLDLGFELRGYYKPWRTALSGGWHVSSGLSDMSGDTVYLANLSLIYYP